VEETGGPGQNHRPVASHLYSRYNLYFYFSVTDKISESMNIIANEPSLAFFRVQEHVRKSLPQLVETKV